MEQLDQIAGLLFQAKQLLINASFDQRAEKVRNALSASLSKLNSLLTIASNINASLVDIELVISDVNNALFMIMDFQEKVRNSEATTLIQNIISSLEAINAIDND